MKSYVARHSSNSDHEAANIKDFKILNMGYNNNSYERRIFEALFTKQYWLSLNLQENLVQWELFN